MRHADSSAVFIFLRFCEWDHHTTQLDLDVSHVASDAMLRISFS